MNSETKSNPLVGLCVPQYCLISLVEQLTDGLFSCVTFGLLGVALLPMIILVNMTPEIPVTSDIDTDQQQNASDEKGGVVKVHPETRMQT